MQFAYDMGLVHKRIKRDKHKEGIYHIQQINTFSSEKESVRLKNFIIHSNISHSYTKIKEFKNIKPIFI